MKRKTGHLPQLLILALFCVAVLVASLFFLVRRRDDPVLREYRALMLVDRDLIRRSELLSLAESTNTFQSAYAVLALKGYAPLAEKYQERLRFEGSLLARGFLVRTNVGPIPEARTFFDQATTNPSLTGISVKKWSRRMDYFSVQTTGSNSDYVLVVPKHRLHNWLRQIEEVRNR